MVFDFIITSSCRWPCWKRLERSRSAAGSSRRIVIRKKNSKTTASKKGSDSLELLHLLLFSDTVVVVVVVVALQETVHCPSSIPGSSSAVESFFVSQKNLFLGFCRIISVGLKNDKCPVIFFFRLDEVIQDEDVVEQSITFRHCTEDEQTSVGAFCLMSLHVAKRRVITCQFQSAMKSLC